MPVVPASRTPFRRVVDLISLGRYQAGLTEIFSRRRQSIKPAVRYDLNRAWYFVGLCFMHLGDWVQAESAFVKSLHFCPGDTEAMFYRAKNLSRGKRHVKAHRIFMEVHARESGEEDWLAEIALYNAANALFDLCRFSEAASLYRRLLRSSTVSKEARLNLKRTTSRMAAARADLKKSLSPAAQIAR